MALRSNRRPFISMKFRNYVEKLVHCNPFCNFSGIFGIAPLNVLMHDNQSLLHVLLKILVKFKTVESRSLSLIFVI